MPLLSRWLSVGGCFLGAVVWPLNAEDTERDQSLEIRTFEDVWSTIHESYFDPEFGGLDWIAIGDTYRRRARKTSSPEQLRPILNEMLGELGESHFGVIPGTEDLEEKALIAAAEGSDEVGNESVEKSKPEASNEESERKGLDDDDLPSGSYSGIHLRLIGKDVVISRVMEGSPAEKAGLRPGQQVVRIGKLKVESFLAKASEAAGRSFSKTYFILSVLGELTGKPDQGEEQSITVVNPRGRKEQTFQYRPIEFPGKMSAEVANLPSVPIRFEERRLPLPQGDVLYISFNIFLPELMGKLRKAIKERSDDVVGIVVDVRGNPGGIGAMANGLAGLLTDEQYSLGQMTMRSGQINFVAFPQKDAFLGPVAILVDAMSASTSELFAAGMQEAGRARIFGRRTMGAALPSFIRDLPNGDRLQHAIADMRTAKGRRVEGRGVIPDVKVPLRSKRLFAGQDPTLDKAMKWLQREAR